MAYRVRVAESADRAQVLDLVRLAAPGEGVQRWWSWLAERNPHGTAVTLLAEDTTNGAVMGAAALFPQRMSHQGREVRGALVGVLERSAVNGVAKVLGDAVRRGMREHGFEIAIARAPGLGIGGPRGGDAREITTAARYVRPLTLRAVGLRVGPAGRVLSRVLVPYTRAHVEPATFHDTRVAAVWRDVRNQLSLTLARDSDFYTWRFVTSPSQTEQAYVVKEGATVIAACAVERVENRLRIVDLVARRTHWGSALRAIFQLGRRTGDGCDKVEMRLTPEQADAHQLWRHGFVRRFGEDLPVALIAPEGPVDPLYYDPHRWFFTGAENF